MNAINAFHLIVGGLASRHGAAGVTPVLRYPGRSVAIVLSIRGPEESRTLFRAARLGTGCVRFSDEID